MIITFTELFIILSIIFFILTNYLGIGIFRPNIFYKKVYIYEDSLKVWALLNNPSMYNEWLSPFKGLESHQVESLVEVTQRVPKYKIIITVSDPNNYNKKETWSFFLLPHKESLSLELIREVSNKSLLSNLLENLFLGSIKTNSIVKSIVKTSPKLVLD
jgi:hypothetical protein